MSDTSSPFDILRLRMPLWLVAVLLGVALVGGLFGGLLGGFLLVRAPVADCPESEEVCAEFGVFWEAWSLARNRYVDAEAADPSVMIVGAINGMINSLGDRGHTRYLTAAEAQEWEDSLSGARFEGIGAFIDVRNGQTMIVAPIEQSPAEEAGLRPGDLILAVDGVSTEGWTVEQLQANVRGPRGTPVTLLILHLGESEPVEITIVRAAVNVPSVSWRMLPDNIALVRLSSFDRDSGSQLRNALRSAQSQGARAVIFDLRNNPGGLVDQAIEVASQFLPRGTTVLIEESRDGRRTENRANRGGVALDIPLVVLINGGSASSAEIVSAALQAAERALLVGETTFGTGTVLKPFRLRDGSRLFLGTQQWLTPEGELIRGQGISPDEEVILPFEIRPLSPAEAAELDSVELRESRDAQLVRALELAAAAASR
ncbi:S41 family peptidase [Candidatus Viridilinea mediisalina]|uniref:Carboxyl-terminal protease n=1 Tax=Candidatus Viridilinea mediisalina TaxID=2024553 RepID=A0A2A6RL19_9CHLR|nr:S41 family peptidase [Candidatus Viridilinea mediisalina]PDW03540.1 carboxyl-terminal protease [Candidatus Viridilinea mediisalina]